MSFDIYISGYASASWADEFAHFAQDDPSSFPAFRNTGVESAYAAFRARRRSLLAVSPEISDRINALGPTWLVPNGIDPDEWRQAGTVPAWLSRLPRPIGLYSGTVDERLDIDLVVAGGRALDGGSFLFFGPVAAEVKRAILSRCSNAVFYEAQNRDEIVGVTRNVDVCLIPHVVSSQTSSMSPLKLFEYLAAGKPVASIALPSTRNMKWVFEGEDAVGFGVAVVSALEAGEMSKSDQEIFLRDNSWAARFAPAVDALVAGALGDK